MKNSGKIFILLVFFYSYAYSQKAHEIIVSERNTITNFGYYGVRSGAGLDLEYFIGKNFSVRGGATLSNNYIKLTPAPLFWSAMLEGRPIHHGYHYHHLMSPTAFLTMLALSDGFSYYIPIHKDLYITPFIAPLQFSLTRPAGGTNFASDLFSSCGVGLKYLNRKNLSADISVQFNKETFQHNLGQGLSLNFSIGYRFNKK